MRSFKSFIGAMLVAVTLAVVPSAVSAQTLDRILGLVTGATAYGYNSCSYVNGGLQSASCQANRALNVVSTIRQSERNAQSRQREQFDRRARQLEALQRACKAGDDQSCARSGGGDGNQMQVARALMDACTAGDRSSCQRANAMMDERNVSRSAYQHPQRQYQPQSQYQPRYQAPAQYQQQPSYDRPYQTASTQTCRAAIDARTGYRIPGQLVCR